MSLADMNKSLAALCLSILISSGIVDLLMGQDMELEFDKYCKVGGSPKTVLPSPRRSSRIEKRIVKGKLTCTTNDLFSLEEGFKEINFRRYRSSSCKFNPSRSPGLEGNEVLRRGSVYQNSKEVRKMRKIVAMEGRRKIESSGSHAFSMGIVDSLCSSEKNSSLMERKRSSVVSINSDSSTTSVPMPLIEEFLDLSHHGTDNVVSSDGFLEMPSNLNGKEDHSAENMERQKMCDPKFRCDPDVGPIDDGIDFRDRDTALALHKSLSAKLALPLSPSQSESDGSKPSSPKTRFSPIKKMFDPFTKSKSQRSPLGSSASEPGGLPPARLATVGRNNNTLRKSLLNEFSNTMQSPEFGSQFGKKDHCNSAVSCSPAHLHGCLKLENKHGVPFFEFSLKYPEDVFMARTWKADNALNWVYTFHNRRKSNNGWGLKDSNKESSMVGQMQVSCYLCTELKDAGSFENSMVTEFVLYDVAHGRRSVAARGNPNQSSDVVKPPKVSSQSSVGGTSKLDNVSDQSKLKLQLKHSTDNGHFDKLTPHPWALEDLHPSLEIAAVVIQVPFAKRESLKHKGGDEKSDQPHPNLLDLSAMEERKKGIGDCSSTTKVNVVTPSGNHSLPSSESRGPSPLLDRWRLGGGCDCGGWDMACPLTVFGSPNIQSGEDYLLVENQRPLELFVQGSKGKYTGVDHDSYRGGTVFKASIAVGHEREKQLLQCNSLRVFIEEEVKDLIEAVTEEEKRKVGKMEEIPPSFKLNPPFSPIARV
ncbi:unnamed protein product [Camellia sinensis]